VSLTAERVLVLV